ncbi:MAG TPA: YciI family protein [Devosia sp.]|jgi:hypothetical protein|nr:YciI family protein [Devosia sp.]
MKFMFVLHGDEARMLAADPDTIAEMMQAYAAYNDAIEKAGIGFGRNRLRPSAEADIVEMRNGATTILDGPYADTKERMGGYVLIDVPDRQTALDWAARCPAAKVGTIEVRQIWET